MKKNVKIAHTDSQALPSLLTLMEACKILKCHPNTLRHWDTKGILPAIRIGEKKMRRYRAEEIKKFIRRNEENEDEKK